MTSSFDIRSDAFTEILNEDSSVEHIATGFAFTEGPIWASGDLLFSDIPNSRIVRYHVDEEGASISTYKYPSGNSNGLTLDHDGNLIACEHTNRRVSMTDSNGNIKAVATRYKGKRLNSPNDVVVKSDGWIYFTDPPYGLMNRTQGKELDFNGVFRVSSNGTGLELLIKDMTGPNGIAFSPDEKKLYVADSMEKFINVYEIDDDGHPVNGKQFADLDTGEEGVPDGMKIDTEGRVYSTGPGGIWVFSTESELLGKILMPEIPANCGWGEDGHTLFITARTGLYKIGLNSKGNTSLPIHTN
ncbi:MAG TPA: SMP-30/gluconolactonase/LRE family protein [Dehalococcoidia bacterium]|nr:SMP-30/gluconolactonase/LRE family protein [Dehalococcoidia bacterium]